MELRLRENKRVQLRPPWDMSVTGCIDDATLCEITFAKPACTPDQAIAQVKHPQR